jgi:hypothetical protein
MGSLSVLRNRRCGLLIRTGSEKLQAGFHHGTITKTVSSSPIGGVTRELEPRLAREHAHIAVRVPASPRDRRPACRLKTRTHPWPLYHPYTDGLIHKLAGEWMNSPLTLEIFCLDSATSWKVAGSIPDELIGFFN